MKEPKSFSHLTQILLEEHKLDACFAIGSFQERIVIIGRSKSKEILDVGILCKSFGGGGHACAASAGLKNTTLNEVFSSLFFFQTFLFIYFVFKIKEKLYGLIFSATKSLLVKDIMHSPVFSISEFDI